MGRHFEVLDSVETAGLLALAFLLGTLIGAERQYRQRNAGLRTNVLVAVGAAAFVHLGFELNQATGAAQIVAYVVSGVGFLGAGVIMREGREVRGLNTAATLWGSAAVGACCGATYVTEALMLTVLVLAGNTLLRPLVNAINRAPLDESATEARYEVRAIVGSGDVMEARDLLVEMLEAAHYPVHDVDVEARNAQDCELVAELTATSIDADDLDRAVKSVESSPLVHRATWTVKTAE